MREFLLRHRRALVTVAGIALPLFLLYVHGRSPRKTTIIEKALMQVTSPVQGAASRVLSGLSDLWNGYIALVDLAAENERLEADRTRLEGDSARLVVALAENERLRRELEFKRQRRDLITIAAHVIGKDLSPYGRILRIALDVGSGSGWTTALIGQLVGPKGSVLGVEAVPELVSFGRDNLAAFHLPWTQIEPATPGVLGAPQDGPFDRILVSADARELPTDLEAQLAVGGRMVVPASGVMWVVDREHDGWHREPIAGYRFAFVPLV